MTHHYIVWSLWQLYKCKYIHLKRGLNHITLGVSICLVLRIMSVYTQIKRLKWNVFIHSKRGAWLHRACEARSRGRNGNGGTPLMCRMATFPLTKILHAFLIRLIQEKVALLDGSVHFEAKPQTCIFHQVWVDVMSQGLKNGRQFESLLTWFRSLRCIDRVVNSIWTIRTCLPLAWCYPGLTVTYHPFSFATAIVGRSA